MQKKTHACKTNLHRLEAKERTLRTYLTKHGYDWDDNDDDDGSPLAAGGATDDQSGQAAPSGAFP